MKFTTRLMSGKKKGQIATCRGRINKAGQLVGVTCSTPKRKTSKKNGRKKSRRAA